MIKNICLFLLLTIGLFGQNITGSGTAGSPYILYNALDVDSIRYLGMNGKYYELGNSISLLSIAEFVPIPLDNNNSVFSFDGKGYTLSGLRQTAQVSGTTHITLGMFVGKNSGTCIIKNLIIEDFQINCTTSTTNTSTANYGSLLIGQMTGTTSNILYRVIVRNSAYRFTCTSTTFPSTSFHGLLVGKITGAGSIANHYIKECLVEHDTLYYSSTYTPNSGHHIGGLAGSVSSLVSVESNGSRYNYFYSRTGSTVRINSGGGIVGELSTNTAVIKYNYSHTNVADFGNGGSPNNFPWGWGGIFGMYTGNNGLVAQENFAVNNRCLGTNNSGAYGTEDNSITTALSLDSTLNFCDITSFTEPNTVYGSQRLVPAQKPATKTKLELKSWSTYAGWTGTKWASDAVYNSGYPYLVWEEQYYTIGSKKRHETFYFIRRKT